MLRFLLIVWFAVGFLAALLCLESCCGKLPAETAPGTYDITVTGMSTDGTSLTHTAPWISLRPSRFFPIARVELTVALLFIGNSLADR